MFKLIGRLEFAPYWCFPLIIVAVTGLTCCFGASFLEKLLASVLAAPTAVLIMWLTVGFWKRKRIEHIIRQKVEINPLLVDRTLLGVEVKNETGWQIVVREVAIRGSRSLWTVLLNSNQERNVTLIPFSDHTWTTPISACMAGSFGTAGHWPDDGEYVLRIVYTYEILGETKRDTIELPEHGRRIIDKIKEIERDS